MRSDTVESSDSVDGVRDLAELSDGSERPIAVPELLDESKQLAMRVQNGLGNIHDLRRVDDRPKWRRSKNCDLSQVGKSLVASILVTMLRNPVSFSTIKIVFRDNTYLSHVAVKETVDPFMLLAEDSRSPASVTEILKADVDAAISGGQSAATMELDSSFLGLLLVTC